MYCGNSSVGRAQPCQGWGREFESRFPLKTMKTAFSCLFSFCTYGELCSPEATPLAPSRGRGCKYGSREIAHAQREFESRFPLKTMKTAFSCLFSFCTHGELCSPEATPLTPFRGRGCKYKFASNRPHRGLESRFPLKTKKATLTGCFFVLLAEEIPHYGFATSLPADCQPRKPVPSSTT